MHDIFKETVSGLNGHTTSIKPRVEENGSRSIDTNRNNNAPKPHM